MFGSQGNNRRTFKESLESNVVVHSEGNRSDNQVTLVDGAMNVHLQNQNGLLTKLTKMRKKIIQMDDEQQARTRQPLTSSYINQQSRTQSNWQKGGMRVGFNLEDEQTHLQMSKNLISKTGDWRSSAGR